jgi:hypothetical protein
LPFLIGGDGHGSELPLDGFFLVGDDCFLGDPVALVVAMFATPMMTVHHRSDLFT